MRILIVGATGSVGQLTTQAALDLGHDVTAFGRSIEKIDIQSSKLTVTKGSVLNAEDVAAAVPGHDVVILTFGAPMSKETLLHEPGLCKDGTANVVKAMQHSGPKRLVCMTMIGVGDSKGHGRFIFRNMIRPMFLGRIAQDREAQEDVVRASGLDWTIVRPTELNDEKPKGDFRVIEDVTGVTAETISRADVADFLVGKAITDQAKGKTYLITD